MLRIFNCIGEDFFLVSTLRREQLLARICVHRLLVLKLVITSPTSLSKARALRGMFAAIITCFAFTELCGVTLLLR